MNDAVIMHDYARYLAAKKTVDDRALNRHVFETLRGALPSVGGRLRVLELGAGLGTMVGRLVDWGLLRRAEYRLLDVDRTSLDDARTWITQWAEGRGLKVSTEGEALSVRGGPTQLDLLVHTTCSELGDWLAQGADRERAELLIANAFLDLVEVPPILPRLFELVVPRGLFWFSINFDGETIFEPEHPLDATLMAAYHRSMDERVRYGRPAGESRCGRHLYAHLRAAGASVLASGSSDWVVHAGEDGTYIADERYFVGFILHTIEEALRERIDVAPDELAAWLSVRRAQLERGELVYIAHQLDYCGRVP